MPGSHSASFQPAAAADAADDREFPDTGRRGEWPWKHRRERLKTAVRSSVAATQRKCTTNAFGERRTGGTRPVQCPSPTERRPSRLAQFRRERSVIRTTTLHAESRLGARTAAAESWLDAEAGSARAAATEHVLSAVCARATPRLSHLRACERRKQHLPPAPRARAHESAGYIAPKRAIHAAKFSSSAASGRMASIHGFVAATNATDQRSSGAARLP